MRELRYKHCPCGAVIDDAQTHCSDECSDMPKLKNDLDTARAQLSQAESREAALAQKVKELKDEIKTLIAGSKSHACPCCGNEGWQVGSAFTKLESENAALLLRVGEMREALESLFKETNQYHVPVEVYERARKALKSHSPDLGAAVMAVVEAAKGEAEIHDYEDGSGKCGCPVCVAVDALSRLESARKGAANG